LPVSTEARSIVALTWEASGSVAVTSSPSKRVNRPRTVVTSSWRMANETRERAGSILQVPAT
jgi:hypothetical protein